MLARLAGVICIFALSSTAAAPVALRCGGLLDVRSGGVEKDAVIIVVNGKISQAGLAAALPVPNGAIVVNLSKATCMPGLMDVHDHMIAGYQRLGISVPRATITGAKNARTTLRAGFTTVGNLGAQGYSDVAIRDGINAGDIEGPRLLVSGPSLGITGGQCDNNLLAPECKAVGSGVADGPWAVPSKVREVVKYGADVIKVCASGGVLSKGDLPGTPQLTG